MAATTASEKQSVRPGAGSAAAVWHRSAPQSVRRAYGKGKHAKGWSEWTRHLAGRPGPTAVEKLLPGRPALLWALPAEAAPKGTLDLLAGLERFASKRSACGPAARKAAAEWLAEAAGAVPEPCWAIEAVAWCHALPALAEPLGADLWWALLDQLLDAVAPVGQFDVEHYPLVHQLVAGELALTLGYLCPEITACRKAAGAVSRGVISRKRIPGFG